MANDAEMTPLNDQIEQLLADPLVRLVMTADRVDPQRLRAQLLETAGRRLALSQSVLSAAEITVSLAPEPDGPYRPAVGIALFNDRGEVFVARRIDRAQDGWQMPQGGIAPGEAPLAAALRELREEIGTDQAELIVGFKRQLYLTVLSEFGLLTTADGAVPNAPEPSR